MATLGIQAIDSNGGTAQAALTVNIDDVNDAPTFGPASYSGTVNEEQSSGAAVTFSTAIAATDEDSNSITYSLIGMKFSCKMRKIIFYSSRHYLEEAFFKGAEKISYSFECKLERAS